MFCLVTYDIPDDKRRTKLAKMLKDYGQRVQYSVFECNMNDKLLKSMSERALKILDKEEDSLRIYRLTDLQKQSVIIIGLGKVIEDDKDTYIV
jgi:CRISPR-associated protein Cas2